ncbi:polymorphic toxin type 24 domain-containing protein [Cytobacillus horneckiae]|uniref:polymorphic toxin type 24 domain-containing protein n=1 Tax=Cytobacillus horneckiae TaxID=549687 RepID=UPI0034CE03F4
MDLQYFAENKGTGGASGSKRTSNKLQADQSAEGAHNTFKRDKDGHIYKYESFSEPRLVNGVKKFNLIKRFDGGKFDGTPGADHRGVPTPHINGKKIKGGVRPPEPWEIPNNPRFK